METDFLIRFPFIPPVCVNVLSLRLTLLGAILRSTNICLSNSCPEADVAFCHAVVSRTAQVVYACDVIINICCVVCSSCPLSSSPLCHFPCIFSSASAFFSPFSLHFASQLLCLFVLSLLFSPSFSVAPWIFVYRRSKRLNKNCSM